MFPTLNWLLPSVIPTKLGNGSKSYIILYITLKCFIVTGFLSKKFWTELTVLCPIAQKSDAIDAIYMCLDNVHL
jgi:hypothetical protein